MKRLLPFVAWIFIGINACKNKTPEAVVPNDTPPEKGSYAYDRNFLQQHTKGLIELRNEDSTAKLLLSPEWQGRVMTSTAMGDTGTSFGWLNYQLLSSNQKRKQFNPVGGEERFWIGPEGGQFGFYFNGGDSFNIAHWQVPAIIDTVAYAVVLANKNEALFSAKTSLTNYSGTPFEISITRKISLLTKAQLSSQLNIAFDPGIKCVAYQTDNSITNIGASDWLPETGLASIWLLGMFSPSPQTIVIIPFEPMEDARSYITDNYFGSIPAERLQVKEDVLYFTCDGKFRSKVGISPKIAKPIAASYNFASNTLTLVLPQVYKDAAYVNSKWEQQAEPYNGDVINSYNDGPLTDGTQMGPFYEIESSSPALQLKVNEAGNYKQVTCHLQGSYASLKNIAQQLLNVDLDEIKK